MCQRWTGDIFHDAALLREFAELAFRENSMGATFYFKEHSFAVTKVRLSVFSAYSNTLSYDVRTSMACT